MFYAHSRYTDDTATVLLLSCSSADVHRSHRAYWGRGKLGEGGGRDRVPISSSSQRSDRQRPKRPPCRHRQKNNVKEVGTPPVPLKQLFYTAGCCFNSWAVKSHKDASSHSSFTFVFNLLRLQCFVCLFVFGLCHAIIMVVLKTGVKCC